VPHRVVKTHRMPGHVASGSGAAARDRGQTTGPGLKNLFFALCIEIGRPISNRKLKLKFGLHEVRSQNGETSDLEKCSKNGEKHFTICGASGQTHMARGGFGLAARPVAGLFPQKSH